MTSEQQTGDKKWLSGGRAAFLLVECGKRGYRYVFVAAGGRIHDMYPYRSSVHIVSRPTPRLSFALCLQCI